VRLKGLGKIEKKKKSFTSSSLETRGLPGCSSVLTTKLPCVPIYEEGNPNSYHTINQKGPCSTAESSALGTTIDVRDTGPFGL
jgi:hypothetical protein